MDIVSRRLIVRPTLCTRVPHRTCTCTCLLLTSALHGYCDCGTRACLLGNLQYLMSLAQAISARGKVVSSAQHNLPIVPCPGIHVTTGRHLPGVPKGGPPLPIHTPGGARGPLVVIITMGGTRTPREDHPRPGGRSPRPQPMRRLRSWMSRTEVRVRPPRLKPRTGRQQTPLAAPQVMQLQIRRPVVSTSTTAQQSQGEPQCHI